MKLSGLQKQVIHLYRSCVRMAYKKPVEYQPHWRKFTRDEFDKHQHIPKKSFAAVEHLIRAGTRRLEMYSNDQIKDIH
ncbi:hypothetical protein CANTEDRAFT_132007 [Yamadazyma tenuis ATCC 10573]|uniref:Complex 1 LYR protein domain-containing protein n=1 Tax=Candida tenuis (strain ATCC 10573 / BCRC 21748 / CBS 615 / JCM 9827 / NBRC 10315 / NRRL Y-1498 / VKM Y-70) TaxID=590646 RepID=G3BCA1_CANTC|nr:uncharacterized protein CANTEDRAFT_132007 [Yamadazyma tenuis ATCC 10573]EGV60152.1 hypothetical protein CANTEDRAFT_132007 [Yamadazyma tenuis ATCC 10573]